MLKWSDRMYVGSGMKKKALRKTVADLNAERPVFGKYLVTLAVSSQNQLEIVNTLNLMQKNVYARTPLVVGIASDYDDAVQLVVKITENVVKATGGADIRGYFEEN